MSEWTRDELLRGARLKEHRHPLFNVRYKYGQKSFPIIDPRPSFARVVRGLRRDDVGRWAVVAAFPTGVAYMLDRTAPRQG